jgi:hypothetical protein
MLQWPLGSIPAFYFSRTEKHVLQGQHDLRVVVDVIPKVIA